MTTAFVRDLKGADNLFTAPLLRGGRVTKKDIINSYKYSQAQRFSILKDMYKNIDVETYEKFATADSQGKALNEYIKKGNFAFSQVN